ncbi:MAG: hypothetical protein U1E28_22030 [Beijerinckiaceae bacterium]
MAFSLRLDQEFYATEKRRKRNVGPSGLVRSVRDAFVKRQAQPRPDTEMPEHHFGIQSYGPMLRPIPGSAVVLCEKFGRSTRAGKVASRRRPG